MNCGSIYTNLNNMEESIGKLNNQLTEAAIYWKDSKREQVEDSFIYIRSKYGSVEPAAKAVISAVAAFERAESIIVE